MLPAPAATLRVTIDDSGGPIPLIAAFVTEQVDGRDVTHVDRLARYPGRFADTPTLQPAEIWACESWEPSWLASDGKTVHPFEGREADHAAPRDQFRDIDPGLVLLDQSRPAPLPRASAASRPTTSPPRKPWWKFW